LQPDQSVGAVARGITLVQKNELGRAQATVRERLRQAPNDAVLNYLLAEILLREGARPGAREFQEALDAAQHAVHLKQNFALAYDVLSALYLRSGQTRQAEEASRRALKEDPADSTAVYHLIACLRKRGDKRELPHLVKKLAELAASAREQSAATNRYKLVEEEAGATPTVH
jgi:tetratricopeptide (TPR) repeat protein